MADPFLGEIRQVGFNFAPTGWALCQGQTLSIAQNNALFALLGTTYGGNGQTTFNLPDLQGRAPVGQGNGAGLSPVVIGEKGGQENTTILTSNLPPHTHTVATPVSNAAGTSNTPVNTVPALTTAAATPHTTTVTVNNRAAQAVAPNTAAPYPTSTTGSGIPISVESPYLGVNFIIALTGIFPSRG